MIDFHNHVLPGVDDGPQKIEDSIEMLKHASDNGITEIIQTVHFQHPKMENKNVDYNFLINKINFLQSIIDKNNFNIKMYLSAEVFYLPNLLNIIDNPLVTIGNKKYMLIEFQSNIFPVGYENEFFNIQSKGITPIVAHPERYRFIHNDIGLLQDWIDRGYIIQIDAGSIIGHFGKKIKELAFKMISGGYVHIVGSDAHNNKKRNFCLFEAYDLIEKNFSKKIVITMKQNVKELLIGNNISNMESQEMKKNKSFNKIKKIFKF